MMERNKSEVISLCRVCACVLVALVHLRPYIIFDSRGVLDEITAKGQDGLWIFMILSGYLVYYSYKNSHSIKEYLKKRVIRLVPVYWCWLIVIMVYGIVTDSFHMSLFDWFRSFSFCLLIIPSTHAEGMWGLGRLSSFFAFYLLAPFLFKRIKSVNKGIWVLMITLILKFVTPILLTILLTKFPIQSDMSFVSITPLSDFCFFAIGFLIALGEEYCEREKVILVILALLIFQSRWIFLDWNIVLTIGFVMAVILYYPVELPRWVANIGKHLNVYTYTLYICHASIYAFIKRYFNFGNAMNALCMFGAACLTAVLLHILIERPVDYVCKRQKSD